MFELKAGESEAIHLEYLLPLSDNECYAYGQVENKGFRIYSFPGEIMLLYEAADPNNQAMITIKGKMLLINAIEDNTVVHIACLHKQ